MDEDCIYFARDIPCSHIGGLISKDSNVDQWLHSVGSAVGQLLNNTLNNDWSKFRDLTIKTSNH